MLETFMLILSGPVWTIFSYILIGLMALAVLVIIGLILLFINDRWWQNKNLVYGNFPVLGRMRYVMHELRPFFRQYFGDDNAWAPRIIIDWILDVSNGKTGYFAFDKFDTTRQLHNGQQQMIHSATPLNVDEMGVQYPLVGKKRKNPLQFESFFYRSAMSLGALGFEATAAMAAACADAHAPFNTGEGGFSVHHIPRVKFSKDRKFFKYKQVPVILKPLYWLALGVLFGKKIYEALEIAIEVLEKHQVRDQVKVFASAKLYAPHMSARALALGADAVGNARSIMIAGGCIRAGLCSGEHGNCPVGMATMKKSNRRSYAQSWDRKVQQIQNYIKAHNKGLIQVASICGVASPSLLQPKHIAKPSTST